MKEHILPLTISASLTYIINNNIYNYDKIRKKNNFII